MLTVFYFLYFHVLPRPRSNWVPKATNVEYVYPSARDKEQRRQIAVCKLTTCLVTVQRLLPGKVTDPQLYAL